MQRAELRIKGETDKEYERRKKISRYGIEGEQRVYFQLIKMNLPMIILSDVRISEPYGTAQADFIVITKKKIIIIEAKNLFGNIKVNAKGDVTRIINRRGYIEECGMENPFNQVEGQAAVFQKLISYNSYTLPVDYIIVMANPETVIYTENDNYPIIRYDKLRTYFENEVETACTVPEFNKLVRIGEFIKSKHKQRDYYAYDTVHKHIENSLHEAPDFVGDDLRLFEEIVEYRRHLAEERRIPACNIFINEVAKQLVIRKPKNPVELMRIPGIKEKKYLLFGEDILAIIRKYLN